ncbi:MAG TPA: tetratricopeptide repeat protein [Usitatibacteraceae bacterium]
MQNGYRFGQVEVRSAERRLLIAGKAATIGARAFDVLLALIERRERLVGKNELLELVWPGVIVEENNLQVQISTLRKLLGAKAVATIAGRGYRFTLEADEGAPAPAQRHNLPAQLNSFVGRATEIAEARLLLGKARLLTLSGAGGTGKTRLSLQLAAGLLDEFPDGVWFVELAALADERLLPQAVASVLQVREQAGHSVLEAVLKYLGERRLLLVLDNCEALVRGCAELARQLLQAGPQLKILASSREHLRVAGETVYPVPALAVPDIRQSLDAAAMSAFDAVRLFVDRAQSVQPAFRLSTQNAGAVAAICHRLDGLPLAIELAAARVLALPVEKIAARLDDRFHLLTGGDRALPHHQTLRASIDWSHDLLSEAERGLLRRLAVFAGGWTLEAAEAVGADGAADAHAVLDVLTALIEKSLVAPDADGERYRLLETVRAYAQEKLAGSGEAADVRNRHLAYCLALAETARPHLNGAAQGEWMARLDADHENLLAAHAWCESAPTGADSGLKLVFASKLYWFNRGLLALGHRLTVEALARRGAEAHSLLRCRVLLIAGQLDVVRGRYAEALVYLEESLAIARELGDQARIAAVLQPLGVASMGRGDLPAARDYLREALLLAESVGDPRDLGAAMTALAQLHRIEGALDLAQPLYERAVGLARQVDDRESVGIGLLNLAMVAITRHQHTEAATMLTEVVTIIAETGSKLATQSLLEVSAGLASQRADWTHAARWFGAAEAQAARSGSHPDPGDKAFLLPLVTLARASMGDATFAAAATGGSVIPAEQALAEAGAWLARQLAASRHPGQRTRV